jgi:hypothetical protein
MNVEIGAEAALFLEKEYIIGILLAVRICHVHIIMVLRGEYLRSRTCILLFLSLRIFSPIATISSPFFQRIMNPSKAEDQYPRRQCYIFSSKNLKVKISQL